ncbi:MAG: amino acid adenylation domain-containing protein [Chloroflexi bacterium]|nr:amino acid adenylation domain-containing protein [Chloroflexota bacterium]
METIANRIASLSPEKRALLARQLQKPKSTSDRPPLVAQPRTSRILPLSFAQERQWFLNQWDSESALYTIAYAVRYLGPLDVGVLQRAVDQVVARHEILRTTFATVDGVPQQVIAEHGSIPITQIDISDLPAAEREQRAALLATAEVQRPFDLANGPLIRMSLIRMSPHEHVQTLAVHHIIYDGWSAGVMIREIAELFAALSAGQSHRLPALPVQYADVALWQRRWLTGETLEQHLNYWKQQLGGTLPALTLPSDRPYPPVLSDSGARCRRMLPPALVQALKTFNDEQGVTLFMTLLAAWKTLLYRYTRQDDILVGTPVAGRTLAQTEPLIGYFANTLVLRSDLGGDPTFSEVLQRVRTTALAAYNHQDLPFEKVVEALQPERSLSHSPLFQVMFVLQNDQIKTLETADLTVVPFAVETGTAKFSLTLEASQIDGDLALALEYKTDLFDAPTIERMLDQYQTLLSSIVSQPSLPISRLALLTAEQRQQMIETWHVVDTDRSRQQCLHEIFSAQATATPDAVAVTYQQTSITYGELDLRSNQVAQYLHTLGITPGEALIGLCVEPSIEMIVGILGILKAGGAYVPIDPAYPAERIAFVLEDAQVKVLLTQSQLVGKLPQHTAQIVSLDGDQPLIAQQPTTNLAAAMSPDYVAYVIYTSGSTGKPKGVQVTHGNVSRLFSATEHWYDFGPRHVWTLFHSFAFDFSVWEIWGALLYGGRLVVVPYMTTRSPQDFYQLLSDEGVTVLNQTPSAFRQLMQVDETAFQPGRLSLEYVIFGGEALNLKSLRPWFARHGDQQPQLINMYGITETTVHVTYRPLSAADVDAPGSMIGQPIPDLQLYILDEHHEPVPLGIAGELYVGGAGVARGYLNRENLTAERFIQHPFDTDPRARLYKTGDLARMLPSGDIEYGGRGDKQVKIRGFRIELSEIESVILQHPAVRETIVVAAEDTASASGQPDQRLIAYLVVHQEQAPTFGQLRSFVKRRLPEHMIPAAFITLDTIPMTHNGKVNYRALPARESGKKLMTEQPAVATSRPIEHSVARIWGELLGVEQVGLQDNFFEIGGHSLLATQVMTRIQAAFGVQPSLRDFFATPTVAGLVQSIEIARDTQTEAAPPPLLPLPRSASLPLSFAQQRMWYLSQLQPDSALYNVPLVFRFAGKLQIDLLERALSEIVRRHEALRTVFLKHGDEATQQINPAQPVALPLIDLSAEPATEREAVMRRVVAEEIQRPFDLARDPMLRGLIVRLNADDHVLALSVHHIAFDEWSSGVLQRELTNLYHALASDQTAALADLPVQYADVAAWQRDWLQGNALDQQLSYWTDQLRGPLPVLDMPTDYPRPEVQTNNGAHESIQLPASLYAALNNLAQGEGATIFMALMAGWSALLQRYTGQDDILVGTPIANRNRRETEHLIGFFVNTLVIRNDLSDSPTFREAIRRTREVALNAYAHQDLPFDQLVQALQPDRYLSRSPLFQALLALQNVVSQPFTLPDVTITPLPVETGSTKFELSLVLYDQGGMINGWLEYNTDLFSQATMQRLLAHLQILLERAVAAPDQPLAQISLVTAAEQQQLLGAWTEQSEDEYSFD